PVDRVAIAFIEIERTHAERVVRPPRHAACPFDRVRIARHHFRRRRPCRPFGRAPQPHDAGPAETFPSDAYSIAYRLMAGLDQIEKMLVAVDDYRARLLGGAKLHDLTPEGLGNL